VHNELLGGSSSQATEVGIAAAVALRRQWRWLAENRNALDSSNTYVWRVWARRYHVTTFSDVSAEVLASHTASKARCLQGPFSGMVRGSN